MSSPPNNAPQFATAEYAASGDTCKSCKQPIKGTYYRLMASRLARVCTKQLQSQIPKDSHPAFVRALLFGVGAAILGLILYAAFGIITGIEIGMRRNSRRTNGRRNSARWLRLRSS